MVVATTIHLRSKNDDDFDKKVIYQRADDNVVDHLRADVNVNIIQEKPEVPDVEILHCGQMLHHKMGIKVVEDQNC